MGLFPSSVYVFLFTLLFTFLPASLHAADLKVWPKNLEPYLKTDGNCIGPEGLETSRLLKAKKNDKTPSGQYIVFAGEEVCRFRNFKESFVGTPESFCPGVSANTFSECVASVLNTFVDRAGVTTAGFTQLLAIAALQVSKYRPQFSEKSQSSMILLSLYEAHLDAFDRRIPIDFFVPSGAKPTLESQKLKEKEEEASTNYARKMLQSSENIMKQLEDIIRNDRTSASDQIKKMLLEHRKKLSSSASRWKFQPGQ